MRILHVIAGIAPRDGGPSKACVEMARALARRGHEVTIMTTNADGDSVLDVPTDRPVAVDGVTIRYFAIGRPRFWGTSVELARGLRAAVPKAEIVHIHSLYLFHDLVAGWLCRRHAKPYLVRPHGTLDPYIWRRHRWRKRVVEIAFNDRLLAQASAVHYVTEEEAALARPYAHNERAVVIPNGLDLDDYADLPPPGAFRARHPEIGDRRIVLYLGRLNFKKGLDILADAYAGLAARRPDVHLVIAGPDDGERAATIRRLEASGAIAQTSFTGLVLGAEKLALLRDADVFVLPSYSENFGISVIEALACGVPVVISDKVNLWREIATAEAGVVVPTDSAALAAAIESLLDQPARAQRLAANGRALVEARFQWREIAVALEAVYSALAKGEAVGGPRPAVTGA